MAKHRRANGRRSVRDTIQRANAGPPEPPPTQPEPAPAPEPDATQVIEPVPAGPPPPPPAPRPGPAPAPPSHRPAAFPPGPAGVSPELRVLDPDGRTSRVTVDTADDVALLYPDGHRIPVDWQLTAVTDGGARRSYAAEVPHTARLTTGMVIEAGPVQLAVKLHPTRADWWHGGGQ